MSSAIELVCFDWGGVILRICRTWDQAVRRAGLPSFAKAGAPDLVSRRQAIALSFQKGLIEPPEFFERIAETTAGCYTPGDIVRVHEAWLCEEYEGVAALLDRVGARARTALLSNTNAAHFARGVGAEGVAPDLPAIQRLHARHASHLLRLAKPEVAIYDRVVEIERTPPGRILFFDDMPENVEAARLAGWHAELVDHGGDPARQMAAHLAQRGILG